MPSFIYPWALRQAHDHLRGPRRSNVLGLPDNRVHYVRDTTWREDANQAYTGNGPRTFAILRDLAVSLFRLHGVTKIKETTEFIGRDRNRALAFLVT